ncbi:MAG: WD40 repeat domain-containing protein, partial [Caldilineaceae bacterium]|nr:WD40 repeat domain-containing protein [Caldilineaceae bacterium]
VLFSVAFSPNGRLIAGGCKGPYVYVWESNSADLRYICPLDVQPISGIRTVAFHPQGELLAAATDNGALFLWDVANAAQSTRAVGDMSAQSIQPLLSVADEDGISAIAFSPDGARLASGGSRGLIKLWHATTLEEVQTLHGHRDNVRCVAWSPDGAIMFSGSFDQTVRLWNIERGQCEAMLTQSDIVWSAALSSDGQTLALCSGDSSIRICEVKANWRIEMVKILQGHRSVLPAVAFSPSGELLALGGSTDPIRLWDITQRAPQCVSTLQSHDWTEVLAFSPDGRYLASTGATNDNAIHLWDVATRQCINVLAGHAERLRSLAFAPDGAILASAGRDFTIRLWDVKNPRACRTLRVLQGHENMVYSIDFNHDGAQLASCSQDQTIRFWDTTTGQQIHCIPGLGLNRWVQFSPHANILDCSAALPADISLLDT